MVPLFDVRTNWRVLQATAHIDNWVLADLPRRCFLSIRSQPCLFEHTRRLISSLDLEHTKNGYSFTGSVMEMVRTFLADWPCSRPDGAQPPDWTPVLPLQPIEFSTYPYQGTLRWECQCLLQESIANMNKTEENFAASQHLIMLFILAFPGIRVSCVSEEPSTNVRLEMPQAHSYSLLPESTSVSSLFQSFHVPVELSDTADDISMDQFSGSEYAFSTPFAPQDIEVTVERIGGADKIKNIMKLVAADGVEKFCWADWLDVAMGFIKGVDDMVCDVNRFKVPEHILNWRKRTPSKVDLNKPLLKVSSSHPELRQLARDILIWTGWAPFDIKVVQFEIDEWLQAAGLLYENCDVIRPEVRDLCGELRREMNQAEEGILKILGWKR